MQRKVSVSPLKGPKRPAGEDPFTSVLDSEEEEGKKNTLAEGSAQEVDDLDAVASICEVFEIP